MDISFTWQSDYLEPVTSIALIGIGFIVFWFFTNSDFLQRLCKKRYGKDKSLITGNIWVAFFTHVLLALSNDYFALYHNPEMKIIRR